MIDGEVQKVKKKFPAFGNSYCVTQPAPGAVQVLRVVDEIATIVPIEAVAMDIVKYCKDNLQASPDYQMTKKDAEEAAKTWSYGIEPVPAPKMFSWPGETGLTFTKLPWHPVPGPCPTWDGLMARMSNRVAFQAWIWSLFDENSYLQQYVWIHGKGNDGKGCVNRFLAKIFGPAYCSKQPKERGDKFWTHELLGKRITVFPDCNDSVFVTSGFFKSLTGGDPMGVEAKGKMGYTVRFNSKYLILSNERPDLSSEIADTRRIIYCEIESRKENESRDDSDYEEALWKEGGAFLSQCRDHYFNTGCVRQPIPTDGLAVASLIETNEMQLEEIFHFNFYLDEKNWQDWIEPIDLQKRLNLNFKSRKMQILFLSFIERRFGVVKTPVRLDKDRVVKRYQYLVGKPIIDVSGVRGAV